MTDMPHCMYPEGLYSALKVMGTLGHPVYVTENGIADADDTRRRWVAIPGAIRWEPSGRAAPR